MRASGPFVHPDDGERLDSHPDSMESTATQTAEEIEPPTGDQAVLPVELARPLSRYGRPIRARSVVQLATTAAAFALVWWAMLRASDVSYWLTLLLAPVEAGLFIRLFIVFHDCVHGSYFRSQAANRWVGRILGVVTLAPFCYWRRNHVLHHAASGNLDRRGYGDVDTLTVDEYLARPRFGRLCYRLARNPWVFLTLGPPYLFLLKHRLPLGMPLAWRKEWASILWNNVAIGAVLTLASLTIGLGRFAGVHAPVFFLSAAAGVWLFYVQHQFEGTYWQREGRWSHAAACLQGSSFLEVPRWLRWATANIEVHHIHHLCSAIPNYRLRRCMEELDQLPAPRRMTLWQSAHATRLSLWDEDAQRLVGFDQVRERADGGLARAPTSSAAPRAWRS